jgi:hypothetical protein
VKAFISLLVSVMVCLTGGITVSGHTLNNAYSRASIDKASLSYSMTLPQSHMLAYDQDGDGRISDSELELQLAQIRTLIDGHLELSNQENTRLELSHFELSQVVNESVPSVMVRMEYVSDLNIERLRVRYTLFIHDLDPTHQNFLTFYDGDEVIGHTVLEKGNENYEFQKNHPGLYKSSLWTYGMLGGQLIADEVGPLLLLLCIVIRLPRLDQAMNMILVMVGAHALVLFIGGRIQIFPFPATQFWLETGALLLVCGLASGNIFLRLSSIEKLPLFVAVMYGLLHGLITRMDAQPWLYQAAVSGLIAYDIGFMASMVAVLYMVNLLNQRLLGNLWYQRIVKQGVSSCVVLIGMIEIIRRM